MPGPRYLELRSAPRDVSAMAAFGARPNDIATSWTHWMVTRKLESGKIVLERAMLPGAGGIEEEEGGGGARKGLGRMVDDVWRSLED